MTTPLPQTPGDAREDHAQAAAAAVAAIYAQIELVLIATVASLARKVAAGTIVPAVAARHLQRTVSTVFAAATPKIRAALDDAMAGTSEAAHEAITGIVTPPGTPLPGTIAYTRPLAVSLDDATDNATTALQDALTTAVDAAGKVTAELPAAPGRLALPPGTSRLALPAASGRPALPAPKNIFTPYREAADRAIANTRGGMPYSSLSLSRIQAAQKALDDLAAHGITGFTDKAGRNWDLTSYVEMATRTAVSNAWDDMQAKAMVRSGLDLVFTYTHSTEGSCPRCIPWLGKTLSLTGATTGYPTLDEAKAAGFRHPSCRCSWTGEGMGVAEVTNPVALEQAAAIYKASQEQRALERKVRVAGRHAQAAVTPQARTRARRDLATARAVSAEHRQRHGLRMMKVSVQRREHPSRAH
jgi:hypothetical protein